MKIKKKILILGSTGSIGASALNVIKRNRSTTNIVCLSTNRNYKKLLKQSKIFNVKNLIINDYNNFIKAKKSSTYRKVKLYSNVSEFLKENNKKIDLAIIGISGLDGLKPTLDLIPATKVVASANKESIICGWKFIKNKLKKCKTNFIPIDSEHFSIWSLLNNDKHLISKIYLTASGGPLLNTSQDKLEKIKINNVIKHPNWSMGKKISTDSASMMNKVFEVIEASKIFNLDVNKVNIIVHPRSIIHAIIVFNNGLIKVLMHNTTMEIPLFNIIFNNDNLKYYNKTGINFDKLNGVNFIEPDNKKFPYLNILKNNNFKSTYFEIILVTINDKLVNLFLKNKISFIKMQNLLLKLIRSDTFKKYYDKKPKRIKDIFIMVDKVKKDLNKYEKFF